MPGARSSCAPMRSSAARRWVGRRVAALELAAAGERLFVERIRSRGRIFPGDTRLTLRAGDVVAISARRTTLVEALDQSGSGLREIDDKELLDLPGELVDVVVTNAAIDGRTLADLARGGARARRVPQTNHARGPTARTAAGVARVPRRRAHDRRRRGERRACRRAIWAWRTARPTSPTCSSSPRPSSRAR